MKIKTAALALVVLVGSVVGAGPASADGWRDRDRRDSRTERRDDRRYDRDDRYRDDRYRDDRHGRRDGRYGYGYGYGHARPYVYTPPRFCPEPAQVWVPGYYDRWGYWVRGYWTYR